MPDSYPCTLKSQKKGIKTIWFRCPFRWVCPAIPGLERAPVDETECVIAPPLSGAWTAIAGSVRFARDLYPEVRVDERIAGAARRRRTDRSARRIAPLLIRRRPQSVSARVDDEVLAAGECRNALTVADVVRSVEEIRHVERESIRHRHACARETTRDVRG